MSLFRLSKSFVEVGVDADSRGDEWMGWDLGWYWVSKKYVIPLGVVALYENMCISFSLSLSLLPFWSYLSWRVDLEIPITAIQIPPFIIFRHTRLFILFLTQVAADVFHPPHGAEEVAVGEVREIVFGPTAFDEFGELSVKHPARRGRGEGSLFRLVGEGRKGKGKKEELTR